MSTSPAAHRAVVERRALASGAGAVRVTTADDDPLTFERMRAAFASESFAAWGYDEDYAARASSPQSLLPGARSVVCVAVPYATPAPDGREQPLHGRVSNYAWSGDYHRRVREILGDVARTIDELAGAPACAIVCDTAPLAERAFAARAGLGWAGKHTNLIVPGLGSFVFLGELVTTLELAPDPPLRKTCGSCSRCVSACPTGALRGDYSIDAARCISDLTQRTGAVPRALRPLVGDWVWGCDLCQDVCPPTSRAGRSAPSRFAPIAPQAARPDLLALLSLRSSTFKRLYRKTAIGWRGAAVLRRNAAIALGNALDRASVPALSRAVADDPHPLVRGHAAWALGRIGSPAAWAALRARRGTEREASVLEEIDAALTALGNIPASHGV